MGILRVLKIYSLLIMVHRKEPTDIQVLHSILRIYASHPTG
jgi:hypothetical protein